MIEARTISRFQVRSFHYRNKEINLLNNYIHFIKPIVDKHHLLYKNKHNNSNPKIGGLEYNKFFALKLKLMMNLKERFIRLTSMANFGEETRIIKHDVTCTSLAIT